MRTSNQVKMTSTKIKIDKYTSSKIKTRRKRIYKNNISFAHSTNKIDSQNMSLVESPSVATKIEVGRRK